MNAGFIWIRDCYKSRTKVYMHKKTKSIKTNKFHFWYGTPIYHLYAYSFPYKYFFCVSSHSISYLSFWQFYQLVSISYERREYHPSSILCSIFRVSIYNLFVLKVAFFYQTMWISGFHCEWIFIFFLYFVLLSIFISIVFFLLLLL